jgi:hypothetical protein
MMHGKSNKKKFQKFFSEKNEKDGAVRKLSLVWGFMAVTTEPLELCK